MAFFKNFAFASTLFLAALAAPACHKKTRDLTCPANGLLPDDPNSWLFPVGIYPIAKSTPNTNYGTVYNPKITPNDFCTIFNLYVPDTAAGKTCTLKFLFPERSQLQYSNYNFTDVNGNEATEGHFTFTGYAFGTGATDQTTWNNQPAAGPSPPSPPATLSPGNAYIINAGDCGVQAGAGSLEVSGMLCSSDTTFEYFQTSAKCPIGFYVEIS